MQVCHGSGRIRRTLHERVRAVGRIGRSSSYGRGGDVSAGLGGLGAVDVTNHRGDLFEILGYFYGIQMRFCGIISNDLAILGEKNR